MLFLILFSCIRCLERYGCYLFNATWITSFQPLELTLCTKHRLKVKSANYLQFTPFCIFHPKVPSKHKTKNIKAFYIQNIGKTLVKYGWNYRIIWLHQKCMKMFMLENCMILLDSKNKLYAWTEMHVDVHAEIVWLCWMLRTKFML